MLRKVLNPIVLITSKGLNQKIFLLKKGTEDYSWAQIWLQARIYAQKGRKNDSFRSVKKGYQSEWVRKFSLPVVPLTLA